MAYTLKEDYTEPYTDGSGRYKTIAKAGQQVAWETAYAWGLVSTKTEPKEEAKPAKKEETQKG
jgi:hypothetical protein